MSQKSDDELATRLREDIEIWEGQEIEFMEDYPSNASELSKEIAAFATTNAGRIYLGVDDDGNIVGVSAVHTAGEKHGKDDISNRLAGLTQRAIKPSITVTVDFISIDHTIVVKINVPKGVEPVYFSNDIPYVRNLTSSDRATPDQVKELHRQYFLGEGTFEEVNETQVFLTKTLAQLSDFQVLWSDHENRNVNPDLDQMKYDIGSTGRVLLELSMESNAERLALTSDLQHLGDVLEEMEHHEFYIDGGKSWKDFGVKGDEALELTNRLMQRVSKEYQLQENQLDSIKEDIVRNIRELKNCWRKREQYLANQELALLKDTLRRLAYNFNRFGNIPPQFEGFDYSNELRELARNLRVLSSDVYFMVSIGRNPLEEMEGKMGEILQIADHILSKLES